MNMGDMEFSLAENLLTGCFIIFVLGYFLWLLFKALQKRGANKCRVMNALVLSKNVIDYVDQEAFVSGGQVNLGLTEKGKLYKIIFEEQGGEKEHIELMASKFLFDRLREGESGKVIYKGEQLIRFGDMENPAGEERVFVGINQGK